MRNDRMVLALLEEGYEKKTWHGPNLRQAIEGVTAKKAAWRPGPSRHNIWEETLHAAYWKYMARRRLEGSKGPSFVLKGGNFFTRPEKGKETEAAWRADIAILETEHRQLIKAARKALQSGKAKKHLRMLYGVAFHDIYHAGQIRMLRRLQER